MQTSCPLAPWRRTWVALSLLAAAGLSACDPKPPKPQTAQAAEAPAAALPGVRPHDVETPAAAERPGAVATGAVEAGQAGTASEGSTAPAPTGGDAAASAPAR